jgi:hypothetical protein
LELRKGASVDILGTVATFDSIRTFYQPENTYRVRDDWYPHGTYFHGVSIAGPIFVLDGSVDFALETDSEKFINVKSGEYLTKPHGGYRIRVSDPAGVRIVRVLEIPEAFRSAEL